MHKINPLQTAKQNLHLRQHITKIPKGIYYGT